MKNEPMAKKDRLTFLVDESVLTKIIEHDNKSLMLIKKLADMKKDRVPFDGVTTLASFLRSLWVCDPKKARVENIQLILDSFDMVFLNKDGLCRITSQYKNEEHVRNEVINVATLVTGHKK